MSIELKPMTPTERALCLKAIRTWDVFVEDVERMVIEKESFDIIINKIEMFKTACLDTFIEQAKQHDNTK